MRYVVLPLIAPAIVAGALMSVTLSIDEFVMTLFTVGKQPTLPLYIYTRVKFGVTPEVNAVATVMLVVTLGTLGLAAMVLVRARACSVPAGAGGEVLMLAAVFKGDGVVTLEEKPEPVIARDDDVVIEVEACGICGSDLQISTSRPGTRPTGATSWGTSSSAGSALGANVDGLHVGQRVTADPDPKCALCGPCRAGRPASCTNVRALGIFRDGALAIVVKAPADAVFALSDGGADPGRRPDRAAGLRRQRRQQGEPAARRERGYLRGRRDWLPVLRDVQGGPAPRRSSWSSRRTLEPRWPRPSEPMPWCIPTR